MATFIKTGDRHRFAPRSVSGACSRAGPFIARGQAAAGDAARAGRSPCRAAERVPAGSGHHRSAGQHHLERGCSTSTSPAARRRSPSLRWRRPSAASGSSCCRGQRRKISPRPERPGRNDCSQELPFMSVCEDKLSRPYGQRGSAAPVLPLRSAQFLVRQANGYLAAFTGDSTEAASWCRAGRAEVP